MSPVNDLPMLFGRSVLTDTETIRLPADAEAQWDMARWAKSRGGVMLADHFGPVWESGGAITPADLFDPTQVLVDPVVGWPIEEIAQEEKVALRVSAPQAHSLEKPSFIALMVERGEGRIVDFPIVMPNVEPNVLRATSYMEVPDEAGRGVPLGAVIADPTAGAGFEAIHDLRRRPFSIIYADRNVNYNYNVRVRDAQGRDLPPEVDNKGGWAILRGIRIWFYAPAGATFEVGGSARLVLPYDVDYGEQVNVVDDDKKLNRKLSFYINGQMLEGGDMGLAGVEIAHGLTAGVFRPFDERALHTQRHPLMLRTTLTSQLNAIHDICLAAFVAEGSRRQYRVYVLQPQLWVRPVAGAPQFPLDT